MDVDTAGNAGDLAAMAVFCLCLGPLAANDWRPYLNPSNPQPISCAFSMMRVDCRINSNSN